MRAKICPNEKVFRVRVTTLRSSELTASADVPSRKFEGTLYCSAMCSQNDMRLATLFGDILCAIVERNVAYQELRAITETAP